MDLGLIEGELAGLSTEKDKPIWKRIWRECAKTIGFGPVDAEAGKRASLNMKGHLYSGITTPAVANTEFTVPHSFASTPYLVIAVLPNETDAQIVPLKWTRAWDAKRIYLSSSVVNASVHLYIEG